MADVSDDVLAALEKQITDLKAEVTKLGKSLAARASDALEDAEEVFDDTRGRATHLARQVRHQAHVAADVAREHPGTTTAVLSTVGLLGLAVGLVLGGILAGQDRRR